jgi:Concanavalin A-like lectin/glucanases superfamily/Beta-propeller repeat
MASSVNFGTQQYSGFDVRSIPGLALWVDAADVNANGSIPSNGSTLSTWYDKSGNGRNLTAGSGTTTYNQQSVRLSSSYMYVTSAVNLTNCSFFIVVASPTSINNQAILTGRPNTNTSPASLDGFGLYIDYNNGLRLYGYSTSSQFIQFSNAGSTTAFMQSAVFTSTGSISSWMNGTNLTTTATSARTSTAQGFAIGAEWNGTAYTNVVSSAYIYEIIVYNTALTSVQRQTVEGYLAWKWKFTFTTFPNQISGLQLWLDAADTSTLTLSGSNVTQWNDKSGNSRNFQNTLILSNTATSNNVYVIKYNTSGVPQWATRAGGTGSDGGLGISTDSTGNVYVAGYYNSSPFTVYSAGGSTFGTLANVGSTDSFVVKYNSSGIAQWAAAVGGTGNDTAFGNATDSLGNVYVAGFYTSSPLTIYNAGGSTFGTLANAGLNDVFVVKYNTSGTAQWATRIAGTGTDNGYGISADPSGNVYVTGNYNSGSLTIYNASGSTFGTLGNAGSYDAFVVKYDTTGTAQWTTRIAGSTNETGYGISVDSTGNVYVTGYYDSTSITIYNAGGSTFGTLGNAGNQDAFLVKYNSSGTAQWTARIGGTGTDAPQGLFADSSGNVYVAGYYTSSPVTIYNAGGSTFGTLTNVNPGTNDVFVVKYDTTGTAQWATRIAGTGSDTGYGISADPSGNVYVQGYYGSASLTVYNSSGSTFGTLTNSGNQDAFLVKYDISGTAQWAKTIGGTSNDAGYLISTDSAGNVYATGYYGSPSISLPGLTSPTYSNSTITFGSNAILNCVSNITLTSNYYLYIVSQLSNISAAGYGYLIAFPGISKGDFSVRFNSSGLLGTAANAGTTNDFANGQYYVNGTSNPSTVSYSSYTSQNMISGQDISAGTTAISLSTNFSNRYFLGNIYEVLLYNAVPTAAQRQQIEGYLTQKWGLSSVLPQGHPYKSIVYLPSGHPYYPFPTYTRPFQPIDISGCKMWLDGADPSTFTPSYPTPGTSITAWKDKSSNGLSYASGAVTGQAGSTLASPTYVSGGGINLANALNGSFTNNVTQGLSAGLTFTGNFTNLTIFAVVNISNSASGHNSIIAIQGGATSTSFITFESQGSGYTNVYVDSGAVNALPNNTALSGGVTTLDVMDVKTTGTTVYYNGTSNGSASYSYTQTSFPTVQTVWIGNQAPGARSFPGNIYELIWYEGVNLSTSQRQQIEGYLQWKWGSTRLPSTHLSYNFPPSTPIFTPSSLSGLALWLDAADATTLTLSGSNVTQWNDKSGNGNNATGGISPSFSNSGVLFDGSTTYLSTPYSSSPSSETVFLVWKYTGVTNAGKLHDIIGTTVTNGRGIVMYDTLLDLRVDKWAVANYVLATGVQINITFLSTVLNTGTAVSGSLNGNSQGSQATVSFSGGGTTNIGRGATQDWWQGYIYEVVIYNSVLSQTQRQQVEGYLAWKWGVQTSLPTTHPYYKFRA